MRLSRLLGGTRTGNDCNVTVTRASFALRSAHLKLVLPLVR